LKKWSPDDPVSLRITDRGGQFADRKSRGVRRQHGIWSRAADQSGEDLLLDLQVFGGGFDHQIDPLQMPRSIDRHNAIASLPRFLVGNDVTFHRRSEEAIDPLQSGGDPGAIDIFQDHGEAARRQPLGDASPITPAPITAVRATSRLSAFTEKRLARSCEK